jgi:dolichol-phosphate mannosyltransferase
MLKFAWTAAVSFSPLPLRISLLAGFAVFGIGIAFTLFALGEWIIGRPLVPGWTSLIILNTLGAGTILLGIGVLGEYVARIFEEVKGRPLYLVSTRFDERSLDSETSAATRQSARKDNAR